MELQELLNDNMLIKEVNIKTLVSGDKTGRLLLETLYPETIEQIKKLMTKQEVRIVILEESIKENENKEEENVGW